MEEDFHGTPPERVGREVRRVKSAERNGLVNQTKPARNSWWAGAKFTERDNR